MPSSWTWEDAINTPAKKSWTWEDISTPEFVGPTVETKPEKSLRLRQELQQVRESPEAVTAPTIGGDITAPEFAGIPEYQAAYHTPLRLPRVGAPTPEPTDVEPFRPTIEGPMSSMMRGVTKGEARDVAPIAANAVIGAVEPLADPMMPAVIGGMVVAPEVVIPALTAQMGKSGAINLGEGLEALRAGRTEEGVQKVGAAIPELGFAVAPAAHPRTFTRSLNALRSEPMACRNQRLRYELHPPRPPWSLANIRYLPQPTLSSKPLGVLKHLVKSQHRRSQTRLREFGWLWKMPVSKPQQSVNNPLPLLMRLWLVVVPHPCRLLMPLMLPPRLLWTAQTQSWLVPVRHARQGNYRLWMQPMSPMRFRLRLLPRANFTQS